MKTILITGINGFLGSNLAKRLATAYNIVGTEFSLENLFRIKENNFKVYQSDKKNIETLFAENKIDIVIHTATFYGRNEEDTTLIFESNLLSPFHLLDLSIKNHCELFINTASALDRFTSTYALTKKQFHDWLFFRSKEIKTINMQLEHFYGAGASTTNFITAMIIRLLSNEPSINLTVGEQKRDFIYFEDVIDAYEVVINSINNLDNKLNNYEVGSGSFVTIKDLMILLKKLSGSSSMLNFGAIPYRENELMESTSGNSALLKFGWKPKVKLEEGLKMTINEMIERDVNKLST